MNTSLVAVTGCFGHVGTYVVEKLLSEGHQVIGLDILEKPKHPFHRNSNFDLIYVDLASSESISDVFTQLKAAERKVDVLLHIAFIIPPQTSANLALSERINVEGSKSLIDSMYSHNPNGHMIFTSSISTLEPREFDDDPVPPPFVASSNPTTEYGKHKVLVEDYLRTFTEFSWTICKLASVLIPEKYLTVNRAETAYAKEKVRHDTKAQGVNVRNVANAFATIVQTPQKFKGQTFLLGGFVEDRMIFSDFITSVTHVLTGVPKHIAKEVVQETYQAKERYYMHWYEVEKTNQLLDYLEFTYEDFIDELNSNAGLSIKISRIMNKPLFKISPRYARWFIKKVL